MRLGRKDKKVMEQKSPEDLSLSGFFKKVNVA
jgi:hypothetical protein